MVDPHFSCESKGELEGDHSAIGQFGEACGWREARGHLLGRSKESPLPSLATHSHGPTLLVR